MFKGALLAGLLICGDVRDIPDPTAPPCPPEKQVRLCGCGGTMMWDPAPVARFEIEREFLGVWRLVGWVPGTQPWWKFTSDRPLALPGFIYTYRVWAVSAAGLRSLAPSNPVKYVGAYLVCVDEATGRQTSCWGATLP